MKFINSGNPVRILCFLMLSACARQVTNESRESVTNAPQINDTVVMAASSEPGEADFETRINSFRESIEAESDLYPVSVSTSQYESSSDVIWYFDKAFSPRYFKETWAMEGTEGTTEYFAINGELECLYEEESAGPDRYETRWCKSNGGERRIYGSEESDSRMESLPASFTSLANENFASRLRTLTTLVRDAVVESEQSDSYQLKLGDQPYDGDEFTETVTIEIPKEVYNFLK